MGKPILEKIREKHPDTYLVFVGHGPVKEELEEHFKGTPTIFTGLLRGEELSSVYASADTFIMPSDSETLGFVVLESMASGVPVVAANAGGIPNLIKDDFNGFLVEPGNLNAYVEKLKLLRDDKIIREKIAVEARKEAERWSWESATSFLRNVQYQQAIVNFHSRAFGGFGRPGSMG